MDYTNIIICELENRRQQHLKDNSKYKIRAYDTAIHSIKTLKTPILSITDLNEIKGIGKGIKERINKAIQQGKNKEKLKLSINIVSDLLNVFGIGPKKAEELVLYGITSIRDLRNKSDTDPNILTRAQRIGLFCYEDLLKRIPRKEMILHEKILNLGKKGTITGSYRRKSIDSGDIDVILLMDVTEFQEYIEYLKKIGYLKFILSHGTKKLLGVCRLTNKEPYRRIDLLRCTKEEYPYSILYFTGSNLFNVAFRSHCLTLGLSLNEHGFTPSVIGLSTERAIFNHVGLEYVKPENRIDHSCLKLLI